jgi:hypothetical protein
MMNSVEDMAEYGEFIAAVAPTSPVITVPILTTVAMAEETLEKSCIVPAAAAAVLHGDGSGRATYNPRRNVRNLGHATGRPDDVSVGATKPPALEEAAEEEEEEEEEEEDLLGICGLRCRSNAGWQVPRLSCSWCSISRDPLSSLSSVCWVHNILLPSA